MGDDYQRLARFVSETWKIYLGRQPPPSDLAETVRALAAGADPVAFFLATASCAEAVQRQESRGEVELLFPPGHYYSPIVKPDALINEGFKERRRKDLLLEVNFDYDKMEGLFLKLIEVAIFEELPRESTLGLRYFSGNDMYGLGDAIILSSMLRYLRPAKWIEVGSGFSTAILLDTIDRTPDLATALTFIEPYPDRLETLLRNDDRARSRVINLPIQAVPLELFGTLMAGDVLFLDTTHVAKTGSDVNHEFFQILPRLASGVIVHFHDMFADFEYPDVWIFDENKSWNEQYMMRAFLMYNTAFEVIYSNDGFARRRADIVRRHCSAILSNPGGGLWLRKL